jgi:hypothetical protein
MIQLVLASAYWCLCGLTVVPAASASAAGTGPAAAAACSSTLAACSLGSPW